MKINEENIEVLLFDYAEGNLSPQERKAVEEYIEKNPQYKEMLKDYQESPALEQPLNLKFKDKKKLVSLARGKKRRKIVFKPSFTYWSSAVAAVVLLFFFINPLSKREKKPINTSEVVIAENKTKKNSEKTKKYSEKTKKNLTFVIEDEQDTIIHQFTFQDIELPSAEIEKQERVLHMRYEESIVKKEERRPSLASRIAKSIKLDEKIEEFCNSDFVSNTIEFINVAKNLRNKRVITTTTKIRREEKINV